MKNFIIILTIVLFSNFVIANNLCTENNVNISIYWDASLSQKEKNIKKEFEFLDLFFKAYPNSNVSLIVFNTKIVSNEKLQIKSFNWEILKQKLQDVDYDGASDFSLINTEINDEILLFFTDGNSNFGDFEASLYSPRIITISSKVLVNKRFLHETAFYNSGYYINLLESDISTSVKAIKDQNILPKLEFVTEKITDNKKKYIQGIVTDDTGILPNVNISVDGKKKGTITDQYGKYKIAVELGDVLIYSFAGMKSAVVEIGDESFIDINLTTTINELDPAIIKSKKKDDPDIVKIGDREVNIRAIGYAVQSIDSEKIKGETKLGLGETIAGKFAGVNVGGSGNAGDMIIRGINSIQLTSHPTFIVDGITLPRSGQLSLGDKKNYNFLDPNNIADITILKGLAATNRYGAAGRNGVVLIKTKTAKNNKTLEQNTLEDKPSEIKYNMYTYDLEISDENISSYVNTLKLFSDSQKSYDKYIDMLSANKDNVSFFVECSDHFFSINKPAVGLRILSNLIEIFPEDTSVLKILAFNLEKHKLFEEAELVYKQICAVSPSLSQTYLDLANVYFMGKKHQESVNLFKKITTNKIETVSSFNGIENQITNDFRNVLSNRNQQWKTNNIDPKYFISPKYDLRVITEWSHPQTEFKLQYINSKKQYFTLTHTQEENKKIMQKEINEGFTSNEYVLSEMDDGEWFLNLLTSNDYIPNLKYPIFLKVKVYTKFGSPDQKLQIHIINLDKIVKNRIFTSFKK